MRTGGLEVDRDMRGILMVWLMILGGLAVWEADLESRSPNLGPYITKGTVSEPPLRDLLFGSSRGFG